ncbi:MAG: hydroxymethylbilane synthase [Planctomycetota bacterium]
MIDRPIRIATRESPLALWQAEYTARRLQDLGHKTQLVPMTSDGDQAATPIDGSRSVGVFTKRIQDAVLNDEADVAVHSLKDLPTEEHPDLVVAAIPVRADVRDSLILRKTGESIAGGNSKGIDCLPQNAVVGTNSKRRGAQILHHRSDLRIVPLRGNVQTRLRKLEEGQFDATLLAEAGLNRLEMDIKRMVLPLEAMLPAPGQGALGIEVRRDDTALQDIVAQLDDLPTRLAVTAERHLLSRLHGGCLVPIAAFAMIDSGQKLSLRASVLSVDGLQRLDANGGSSLDGDPANQMQAALSLATNVAKELVSKGAEALLER